MITTDMIGQIRRLQSRGKKSEREIARMTGLSRNTVANWLVGPLGGAPKYRREKQSGKLSAFHEAIELALKADAHRPRHERRTARALRLSRASSSLQVSIGRTHRSCKPSDAVGCSVSVRRVS